MPKEKSFYISGDLDPLTFSADTSAIEAADASVVKIFCYDYDGELAATGSGFVAFDGTDIKAAR